MLGDQTKGENAMLHILHQIETILPTLLQDEQIWQSLYVDYHPPTVERLWTAWNGYRVYLHRIHPCAREQALFHPHPWPSAMRVLEGEYEMAVGFGAGTQAPPVAARMISRGDFCYEMTHPDGWHYVRPLGAATLSVMVTGQPWARDTPKSDRPLHPLRPEQVEELLHLFRGRYPATAR
jgi:hypothetical protein